MKPEQLSDSLGNLSPDLVAAADKTRKPRPKYRKPIRLAAAAAALVLILTGVLTLPKLRPTPTSNPTKAGETNAPTSHPRPNLQNLNAIEAVYPTMLPYSNDAVHMKEWKESRKAQYSQPPGFADGLESFFAAATKEFLSGAGNENRVYSPLNVYMALAMLAELTGSESRAQILTLLGAESIEALRTQASHVWNANYCKDGIVTSLPANSLWLDKGITVVKDTLTRLAKTYYASSYQGEMGSADFTKALKDWVNIQTDGILKDQTANLNIDPSAVMALISTVYFSAKWEEEFQRGQTGPAIFHAPDGNITTDFMHKGFQDDYFWGSDFTAIRLGLYTSGYMWLILPDKGKSVDTVLAGTDLTELLASNRPRNDSLDLKESDNAWSNKKNIYINLSMPKFDVASDIDIIKGLMSLGIRDVFDNGRADFSPLSKDSIFIKEARHAARVMADEIGCTGAASLAMVGAGGGVPPSNEIDFTLDRPFLFAITSQSGQPLFTGVVNNP